MTSTLPDTLLLELLSFLPATTLRLFGYTSRTSFAFSLHEDLWKQLFLARHQAGGFDHWRGTWRRTVLRLDAEQEARIDCAGVLSEVLVQPYLNAGIDLGKYVRFKDCIPRFDGLGKEEFGREWYAKPFILTDVVPHWPAYKKWSLEYLLKQFSSTDATFQIEAVEWSIQTYLEYMSSNRDESPLYLFDKDFAIKTTANGVPLEDDYSVPETFEEDLFRLLGDARPDHRWLIVGPERSGSTFHKVPSRGTRMLSRIPMQLVRGMRLLRERSYGCCSRRVSRPLESLSVTVREMRRPLTGDESEVTSPISIADWLRDFYPIARNHPSCIRGVCHAGEVMYIPSGTGRGDIVNVRMVASSRESIGIDRGDAEFCTSGTSKIRPSILEIQRRPDLRVYQRPRRLRTLQAETGD
jgi:hypothetical protein